MGVATGVFQYASGSPVANGIWQWKLSSDAVQSAACIAPLLITGMLDSGGTMTATLIFNDVLTTASGTTTTYQLTVKDNHGGQVWNENYYLTGTAANINSVLPGSGSVGVIYFPTGGGGGGGGGVDTIQTFSASGLVSFPANANTFVEATAGGGGITLTVASAIGVSGQKMAIMQMDSGVGGVKLVPAVGGQTFNGQASMTMTNQYQTITLESDNAKFLVVSAAG